MSEQAKDPPRQPLDREAAAARAADMLAALGPEHAAASEARREGARVRMRKLRRQQSPEQIEREAKRKRQARASKPPPPFMGIDGEGGGTDPFGRQNYNLMVAAPADKEFVLNTGRRLTTIECFEFILSLPKNVILVAFAFGYDVTQILRDIHSPVLRRIYDPYHNRHGGISDEYWKDYAVSYMPGKYLRIGRIDRSEPIQKGKRPPVVKPNFRSFVLSSLHFHRHSPDACGVGAKITLLTGLGNGNSPSVRATGHPPPAVDGAVTPIRAYLLASRHTSPLIAKRTCPALVISARPVCAAGRSATGCRQTTVEVPRLRPTGR